MVSLAGGVTVGAGVDGSGVAGAGVAGAGVVVVVVVELSAGAGVSPPQAASDRPTTRAIGARRRRDMGSPFRVDC